MTVRHVYLVKVFTVVILRATCAVDNDWIFQLMPNQEGRIEARMEDMHSSELACYIADASCKGVILYDVTLVSENCIA